MNNAIAVFNHANNSTQLLRRQADNVSEFQITVNQRETDFESRLIEIFGYPYPEDIGPTGTYPSGYSGPDIYHFDYVDTSELLGVTPPPTQSVLLKLSQPSVGTDGSLSTIERDVVFNLSTQELGLVKPAAWTQRRRAPGEIQLTRSELLQTHTRFSKALIEYRNLIAQIKDRAALLRIQFDIRAEEIQILNRTKQKQESLNQQIRRSEELQRGFSQATRSVINGADALAEAIPTAVGLSTDVGAPIRGAIKYVGVTAAQIIDVFANAEAAEELQ